MTRLVPKHPIPPQVTMRGATGNDVLSDVVAIGSSTTERLEWSDH